MSNPTTPFGWQMPTATDLVTDLPADFEVFGQAVATSMSDLLGGTTGQILSKTSNTDMDFTWTTPNPGDITGVTAGVGISGGGTSGDVTVTNSMATAMTTSGDLIQATGSGTFARLGTGTNGQYLTTNGTTNSWGTITPGGETLISTTTLTGASVTLSSIPQTYKHLKILFMNAYGPGTSAAAIRLNGDTTVSNYWSVWNGGGSTYAINVLNGISAFMYFANQQDANSFERKASAIVNVHRYAETAAPQYVSGQSYSHSGGTGTGPYQGKIMNGIYNKSAAITSITILLDSGTWSGGTVYLYGVS